MQAHWWTQTPRAMSTTGLPPSAPHPSMLAFCALDKRTTAKTTHTRLGPQVPGAPRDSAGEIHNCERHRAGQ
eukprot:13410622-Alexandrium_andersonii.AAC.1